MRKYWIIGEEHPVILLQYAKKKRDEAARLEDIGSKLGAKALINDA